MSDKLNTIKIGLGGGCHWCTEAVFQALKGADMVEQGFARSTPPAESWSEAVIVHFDPAKTPLEVFIEVHLRTHACTSQHSMREKYRSAIYVYDEMQAIQATEIIKKIGNQFDAPIVTQVLPLIEFKLNDEQFLNYRESRPEAPFCQTYIDPKLALLRREYAKHLIEKER